MNCLDSCVLLDVMRLLWVETLVIWVITVGGFKLTVASSGSNALKGDNYRFPISVHPDKDRTLYLGTDTVKQWCRRSIFSWFADPGRRTKL
jgi:hypothetical protein